MIAIKGLKMPINCRACPCFNWHWKCCNAIRLIDHEASDAADGDEKPENCPLVELNVGEVAFVFDGEKLQPTWNELNDSGELVKTWEGKHDEH